MTRTWVTADPHFGHAGVCKFLRDDGTKLRPWDNPDEMDEALVENWNRVVGDKDRVVDNQCSWCGKVILPEELLAAKYIRIIPKDNLEALRLR